MSYVLATNGIMQVLVCGSDDMCDNVIGQVAGGHYRESKCEAFDFYPV